MPFSWSLLELQANQEGLLAELSLVAWQMSRVKMMRADVFYEY